MADIQVDMFEVQLGAAILLQFRVERGVVRVLADAGVSRQTGYPRDHVHAKLGGAFADFGKGEARLDLIIGTHYDEDHLAGLVPIIEDEDIQIGEAWLPPVANDTELHAFDDALEDRHLLANQFAREDGNRKLEEYLQAKEKICGELRDLDQLSIKYRPQRQQKAGPANEGATLPASEAIGPILREWQPPTDELTEWARSFRIHVQDSTATLGGGRYTHADEVYIDRSAFADWDEVVGDLPGPMRDAQSAEFEGSAGGREEVFKRRWKQDPGTAEVDAVSFAYIRRAAASDAINAIFLHEVVQALRRRNIPIRCEVIRDGVPRRFIWRSAEKRFVGSRSMHAEGPELTLLGPSEGLVRRHWNILPLGSYLQRLTLLMIPIRNITPSNQLSYVARFGMADGAILVAGDAGFVDWKAKRGQYHPALLGALLPLQVIQVAHHGGYNAHFYRALLQAGYATQEGRSLLLLSHAEQDRSRPSAEFGMFVEEVRKDGDDVQILFTSEPAARKVRDYLDMIHPPVPLHGGRGAARGDVRIEFDSGQWTVRRHAVMVTAPGPGA
jgi:hypothetical protein